MAGSESKSLGAGKLAIGGVVVVSADKVDFEEIAESVADTAEVRLEHTDYLARIVGLLETVAVDIVEPLGAGRIADIVEAHDTGGTAGSAEATGRP